MTGELGLHGFDQVLIRVAVLQATRFRDGQQTLQEAATRRTLSSEAQLAVDHRRTKSPLGRIIGRFNAFHTGERPQVLAAMIQLVAKADQLRIAAVDTAQQKVPNLFADRCDLALKRAPFDFARFVLSPILKQLAVQGQRTLSP